MTTGKMSSIQSTPYNSKMEPSRLMVFKNTIKQASDNRYNQNSDSDREENRKLLGDDSKSELDRQYQNSVLRNQKMHANFQYDSLLNDHYIK